MQRRVLLERHLRTALERDELTLEYQPLLDRNGQLEGVEALLRWSNAEAGLGIACGVYPYSRRRPG